MKKQYSELIQKITGMSKSEVEEVILNNLVEIKEGRGRLLITEKNKSFDVHEVYLSVKLDKFSKIVNKDNLEYFKIVALDNHESTEDLIAKKKAQSDNLQNNLIKEQEPVVNEVFQKISKWAEENNLNAIKKVYSIEVMTKDDFPISIKKSLDMNKLISSNKGDFLFNQVLSKFTPLLENDNLLIKELKDLLKKLPEVEGFDKDKEVIFEVTEEFLSNYEGYFGTLFSNEDFTVEIARLQDKLYIVRTEGTCNVKLYS